MLSANPEATRQLLHNDLGLEHVQTTSDNVQLQTVGDIHHQVIVKILSIHNVCAGVQVSFIILLGPCLIMNRN